MIKQLKPAAALLAGLLFLAGCGRTATDAEENSDEIIEPNLLYGIPADNSGSNSRSSTVAKPSVRF